MSKESSIPATDPVKVKAAKFIQEHPWWVLGYIEALEGACKPSSRFVDRFKD